MSNEPNPIGSSQVSKHTSAAALNALMPPDTQRSAVIAPTLLDHPLVQEPLRRLRDELPKSLTYHTYQHTMDVFERVTDLAVSDQLSERDILLLSIAAAWHDTGFIVRSNNNEIIAAEWAREALIRHGGFSESEIDDIEIAILDTQIKFNPELRVLEQRCTGRLSPWLLDADLANFGQRNFLEKSAQVYAEMAGRPITSAADFLDDAGRCFIATTIKMMAAHRWHSHAATKKLLPQETLNRARLGHFFAELDEGTEAAIQRAWWSLQGGGTPSA
jgi:uncharacterized protein